MSRKRKCLNEACLLNKELKCDNPRQHRKDFICRGKDEVKAKNNYIRSNTLFCCHLSDEFTPGEKKAPLDAD